VGGNAYDERGAHGVLLHKYGPHIFHTQDKVVWDYLSRFTAWRPYFHRVLGSVDGNLVPVPFNLDSITATFPRELAESYIRALTSAYGYGKSPTILDLRKGEDGLLKEIAEFVYLKVFKNYTLKQWGMEPDKLAPEVTGRVPVRVSRDGRYFTDRYQGMPADGYTAMFNKLLQHELITVATGVEFAAAAAGHPDAKVVYTGPIDAFFGYAHGPLPYRSVRFEERVVGNDERLPTGTVNYPNEYDFTRTTDLGFLTGCDGKGTVLLSEYPQDHEPGKTEPYYPVPTEASKKMLAPYRAMAKKLEGKVWFAGRLGNYQYYNMDQACAHALALFDKELAPSVTGAARPRGRCQAA
jgi:UDP-galactopyranose mutase